MFLPPVHRRVYVHYLLCTKPILLKASILISALNIKKQMNEKLEAKKDDLLEVYSILALYAQESLPMDVLLLLMKKTILGGGGE